jgi:carboxypeptidase T
MQRSTLLAAAATAILLVTTTGPAPAAGAAADDAPSEYRVIGPRTFDDVDAIARTGAAVDDVDDGKVYVTATAAEVSAIRALGFDVETLPRHAHPDATIADYPPGYDAYHTYDELADLVDQLVTDHPSIARRYSFGGSYEGRDLIAVKISDAVEADEAEPEVLFNAGQHAREHLTVEMAIYLLRMFIEEYGVDPRVTDIVDNRVIWILPNVNPDGAEYDIATGSFRSWRKNRQPTAGSSAMGTDLNRNWAHEWGGPGSSGTPSSSTYRGPAPFSAPETDQLRDFVLGRVIGGEQRITVNIDFHTYSELVLWPYGYTTDDTAPGLDADAQAAFQAIGSELADTNGYTPMQASQLYLASGVSIDWMWAAQGIFAYTFEMYPASAGGGGFYPPDQVIAAETARNREASLRLAEYADCPWRAIDKELEYCPVA